MYPQCERYDDVWWQRALDGELSPDEAREWEVHLAVCARCRREWVALRLVDELLRDPPPLPPLPADFTQRTLRRLERRRRRHKLLALVGSLVVVGLVAGGAVLSLERLFGVVSHLFAAIYTGRYLLLDALMRTVVGLMVAWRTVWPAATLFIAVLGFILLAPNGVMATMFLVWLSRRRAAA